MQKNLVSKVYPTQNAENIVLMPSIRIVFTESMKVDSLNENTIFLQKVNGEVIKLSYLYENITKTLELIPTSPLDQNTSYTLYVKKGAVGPMSIVQTEHDRLSSFTFRTQAETPSSAEAITPSGVVVEASNGYISVSWNSVGQRTKVSLRSSEDDIAKYIWPSNSDYAIQSTENKIDIPQKINPGSYYIWIKHELDKGEETSSSTYIKKSIVIEEEPPIPLPTNPFNLNIVRTYPENNSIAKNLDKLAVVFSEDINLSSISHEDLQILDADTDEFMAELFEIKSYEYTIPLTETPQKTLRIIPQFEFEAGKTYKLILSKNIHSSENPTVNLGESKTIQFTKIWEHFFASIESIRTILGNFSSSFDDVQISKVIAELSQQLYARFLGNTTSDSAKWKDSGIPYYVVEYIKYKTAYMLVLNLVVKDTVGQSENIKLGDLQVEESASRSSELVDLLGLLKEEMEKWETPLESSAKAVTFAKMSSSIRASSNEYGATYPDHMTRVPFNELGG